MKKEKLSPCAPFLVGMALTIGFSVMAAAEEPEVTPKPEPTPVETKRPKSLADLASGIKLQSEDEPGSGSVVISNKNLKKMGEGAVLSEGRSLAGGGSRNLPPPTRTGADVPSEEEIDGVKKDLDTLQSQLDAIQQAEAENKKANLYSGSGPQYRAGGVTDPIEDQRKDIEKQIAENKARLSDMEKAANDDKNSSPNHGPTPKPAPRRPRTR